MSSKSDPTIVWLRQDLRLADNPALNAACSIGNPVVLVWILPEADHPSSPGGACKWWLHRSLQQLEEQLNKKDQKLILRTGSAATVLSNLVEETGAKRVFWNRLYEPAELELEQEVITEIEDAGIEVESYPASLLVDPMSIFTKSEDPYQVFTPFWKACLSRLEFEEPIPTPKKIPAPSSFPKSVPLDGLKLDPTIDWAGGLEEMWTPGEKEAHKLLDYFLQEIVADYKDLRNIPSKLGTSRLSPYLHFGEITPRQIYEQTQARMVDYKKGRNEDAVKNAEHFLSEIGWREFSYYVLFHFPETVEEPLREDFKDFEWSNNPEWLQAWKKGNTGYPIVDAGMRELWATGWMHNRVRMIVASFLTKDLQLHWKNGADWFLDTLVDADLANNTFGWQWASGCGADAAPYFRIFNPVLQSEKFDPKGVYLRKWCPELADLPDKWIHKPFEAPAEILKKAGVQLGEDYPEPIVDHSEQRKLALERYGRIKG